MLERFFNLKQLGTDVRTEVIAGITTFLTMAYIIFVQPAILCAPFIGTDSYDSYFGSVMVATCLAAALATLIMGLYAKYPIALASGMGMNAFFAYTIVIGMGIDWHTAMGAVFVSGVIVLIILSFLRVREMIFDCIPVSLKSAIAAGIGMFIALIGLQHSGLISLNPVTMVSMTNFGIHQEYLRPLLLASIGLILISILMALKVKGAMLWGMLIAAVIGIPMGVISTDELKNWVLIPSMKPTFFTFNLQGLLNFQIITIIVVFLVTDVFDTIGTLIGISQRANFLDKQGKLPRAGKALIADAVGTVVGAAFGTSTVTSYIESAAGVEAGGRTGLTSVVTSIMFLLALFTFPIVKMIGGGFIIPVEGADPIILYPITAPALVIVGIMMVRIVGEINWDDITESLPAFLIFVGIPFTFSITDGLALGIIAYPILKIFSGRHKEVSWLVYVLAIIFLGRWILMT